MIWRAYFRISWSGCSRNIFFIVLLIASTTQQLLEPLITIILFGLTPILVCSALLTHHLSALYLFHWSAFCFPFCLLYRFCLYPFHVRLHSLLQTTSLCDKISDNIEKADEVHPSNPDSYSHEVIYNMVDQIVDANNPLHNISEAHCHSFAE